MNKIGVLILAIFMGVAPLYAMGKMPKGPLMENKLQLAEQMNLKLADKMTGLEAKFDKVEAKVAAIGANQMGFNNSLSQMTSELKTSAGRDANVNDASIYRAQLDAQKDIAKIQQAANSEQLKVWKYLFYAECFIILTLIRMLFVYFSKYMDYKEGFIKNLDPKVADKELESFKAKRSERKWTTKVSKILNKKVI